MARTNEINEVSLRAVKLVEVRGSEEQRSPLQKRKFNVVS